MASHARTRLDLDTRRQQLVEVGMGLFSERSYDEISIDDIAERAGISKGLLYHYFPSKREFYVDTVRVAADELVRSTEPSDELEPLEALRVGLDAYLDYVERRETGYVTLMRGGIGSDAEVRDILDAARATIAERLAARLPGGPTPLARVAVVGWVGFVEAAALDWLDRREPARDAVRDLLVEAFLGALAAADRASAART